MKRVVVEGNSIVFIFDFFKMLPGVTHKMMSSDSGQCYNVPSGNRKHLDPNSPVRSRVDSEQNC
jgi:hypothetical protein